MNVFLHFPRFTVASFVGAACVLVFAQSALAAPVIVDVFDGTNPATVAARYGIVPEHVLTEVANAFTADVSAGQIALLEADPDVLEVAADGIAGHIPRPVVRLLPAPDGGAARRPKPLGPGAGPSPSTIPEQPAQFIAAAIRRVKAPLSFTAAIDGIDDRRVNAGIAIVDSGVDPYHPDLNVVGGVDCVSESGPRGYYDRLGHGTMVAGMAAAIDNEIGLVGVAPGARIWAVRVIDSTGVATISALLCGLEYVAKNRRRIDVANLSVAGEEPIGPCREDSRRGPRVKFGAPRKDRLHQSICRLVGKGVTVVVAAGNDAADAQTYVPAAYNEVITVSAIADFNGLPGGGAPTPPVCLSTERDDYFATFSNHGAVVDIAAPGVCVLTTFPGGIYALTDGTSFSAPMVAGAAALLYAQRPGITPELVKRLIIEHAEPGPIPGDPDGFWEGVLDVSSF